LHNLSATFVLGYHGCDRSVGESLLNGTASFAASQNDWDWLGSGIYFWEANPLRGLEFAQEQKERRHLSDPFVLGAVLDLGFCLDLTSSTGVAAVKIAHSNFVKVIERAGKPMPKNRGGPDSLLRELDCAVINHLHEIRASARPPLPSFDSVKGVFLAEGGQIYEGSGFYNKTHIQICIRNPSCIKGVFRVPSDHLSEA
jgi:hypothetical protein